ncbi:MAG: polysaccharide biosynthesis tyrosine autokinase [Gemmatimonadota bacterium]
MIARNDNGRMTEDRGERRLNVAAIWRSARRQPLLSVGIPLLLLASTGFFLWWVAPKWGAFTTIRVDEDRAGVAIIEALQTLSSGSEISTEMEVLRSRTIAEEVVDSLDLHVTVKVPRKLPRSVLLSEVDAGRTRAEAEYVLTAEGDGVFRVHENGRSRTVRIGERAALPGLAFTLAPGAAAHDRVIIEVAVFQEAVRDHMRNVRVVRPNREADILSIEFEGRDRELVQQVPDLAARRFISRRNQIRTQEARSTAAFLDEQIAALLAQLSAAESQLRDYREQYGVVNLRAEGEAQVTRLAEMQAERELWQIEHQSLLQMMGRIEAESATTNAASPYRALLGFPSLLRSQAAADLLRSLHELEARRATLLDRRTMQDPEVQVITNQIAAIDNQLHDITTSYLNSIGVQIRTLDLALARFTDELQQIPEKELQLARLMRQSEVNAELYSVLQLRLKEAEILAAVDDPSVIVVDPAIPPRRPVSPDVPLTLALALMMGLVVGVGGAVLREQLDDTVRTRDELQLLGGAPVLGSIPRIVPVGAAGGNGHRARDRHASRPGLRLADDIAGSPVTEAYRSLRTNINFSRAERRPRILVLTSPAPGDGKSTTAANLASTMAKQGLRCLLVDADLRRGRLHDIFRVRREPGLSNVLLSEHGWRSVIHRAEGMSDFMATGTLPPNPAELLGSAMMSEFLQSAVEDYDSIVLDAPPMNLVTDAAVLSRSADGVLVVARAGVTSRGAITYTFDQLSSVSARVLGSVLNDADISRERYYGSYMQSYYGTET